MAARGGPRPGSGRKKGSTTKRTREIAEKAIASGLTPLEYLMSVMQDQEMTRDVRVDAAKAAAPYIHPRLANVTANADVRVSISLVSEFE